MLPHTLFGLMLGLEGKQLAWKFQFWQREVWLQGLEVGGHRVLGPDVAIGNQQLLEGKAEAFSSMLFSFLVQKNRQFIPAS